MPDIKQIAIREGIEHLERLPRDVSPREYFRGMRNGKSVVVMLYPEINEKNKTELQAFVRIGGWMRRIGLAAPEIYVAQENEVYAVMEDFGQASFGGALREGNDRKALYSIACDVLKSFKNADTIVKGLPLYWNSKIHENRRQIIDYYVPVKLKKQSNNSVLNAYIKALDEIEASLPKCQQGFLHADFHLENLMLRPAGDGLSGCGIIDFQDALLGPLPYDLVNLLEDARVDVPTDLREEMINRYCEAMTTEQRQAFMLWYRFLGTQFHCRVIGLFIKLAAEQRRDNYLVHIPRLQRYIQEGLQHPIMEPLKIFFEEENIDFLPIESMNGEYVRKAFF